MIMKSKPLAALVIAILFGGIFFSSAMGWWQTESNKEAAKFTTGEFAGQANPADIRGSYTFGDVEKNFSVPASVLTEAFGVQTNDPAAFQVKSLEEMYAASQEEISTSSVRLFVAFYQGLPFDLSTDTYLPESAARLLRSRILTSEQAIYLETHIIPDLAGEPGTRGAEATARTDLASTAKPSPQAEETQHISGERLVKGKTTFAELLEWGVSKGTIEKVLGISMPDASGMTVKDYCTENGLSFETIKPALQAEVDLAN